jgi:peptide/nickel transport system substrate-binding protein
VLVVGQIAEPQALDPHAVTAVNDFRILMNLYDGLVRYAPGTLEVEPALAEELGDQRGRHRLYLHPARGRELPRRQRAGRRGGGLQLRADAERGSPLSRHRAVPAVVLLLGAVETVEAVDDRTVRFTLNEPYAPFLSNLAYPTGLIVSPAAVMAARRGVRPQPVGHRAVPVRGMALERGGGGQPQPRLLGRRRRELEAVIFRPITDANTRTAEMLAGGIDMMVEVPPVALSQFQGDGFTVVEEAGPHVWFLILNAKEGPFADVRVRQAANYAINKERAGQRRAGRHRRPSPPARRRRPSPGPITRTWSPIPTTPTAPANCWPRPGPRARA